MRRHLIALAALLFASAEALAGPDVVLQHDTPGCGPDNPVLRELIKGGLTDAGRHAVIEAAEHGKWSGGKTFGAIVVVLGTGELVALWCPELMGRAPLPELGPMPTKKVPGDAAEAIIELHAQQQHALHALRQHTDAPAKAMTESAPPPSGQRP